MSDRRSAPIARPSSAPAAADGPARLPVLWVVDAQEDFMTPAAQGGRLYVGPTPDPDGVGSVRLRRPIADLVRAAQAAGIAVVTTADWHAMSDPEIDAVAPNFQTTFPPHCMGEESDPALAAGAQLIGEIDLEQVRPIPANASPSLARMTTTDALTHGEALLLQKTEFSIFTGSTATPAVLGAIDAWARQQGCVGAEYAVVGVASDVCVTAAVEGLATRGHAVRVLRDCIAGLGIVSDAELATRWQAQGVALDTSAAWLAQVRALQRSRDGGAVAADATAAVPVEGGARTRPGRGRA